MVGGCWYTHPRLRPKSTIDILLDTLKRNRYTFRLNKSSNEFPRRGRDGSPLPNKKKKQVATLRVSLQGNKR